MTKAATKYARLNAKQKRVFDWSVRQAQAEGVADKDAIFSRVIATPEAELDATINAITENNLAADRDALLLKIRARYTEDQLRRLADGLGVDRARKLQVGAGAHHKIGIVSDTHIGSVYSPDDWLPAAIDAMQQLGCECILHCGDLTEGMKAARLNTQIYEIKSHALGYRKMRDAAVEALQGLRVPMYIISGNHDKFFQDDADIVEDVAERVEKLVYLGYNKALVEIGGVRVALFHGNDGMSNTRLQNVAEKSVKVTEHGVQMMFAGHVHKYEVKWLHDCYCVHAPCLQEQTSFMSGRKLVADCGFLTVDFRAFEGHLSNVAVNYYPM